MKRYVLAAVLFAAVPSFGLFAQSMDLTAKIPFDFQFGDKLMPAGEYRFQRQSALLVMHQQGGDHAAAARIVTRVRCGTRPHRGFCNLPATATSTFSRRSGPRVRGMAWLSLRPRPSRNSPVGPTRLKRPASTFALSKEARRDVKTKTASVNRSLPAAVPTLQSCAARSRCLLLSQEGEFIGKLYLMERLCGPPIRRLS